MDFCVCCKQKVALRSRDSLEEEDEVFASLQIAIEDGR